MMLTLQLIVDGLGKGAIFAALGIAIVVTYRSTGLVNFAQGELATLSTMLTVALTGLGLPVWIALLVAVIASFTAGAVVQFTLVRPIMNRPHLVTIMVMIGLYICANSLGEAVFGPTPRPLAQLFPAGSFDIGGIRISWALVGVITLQAVVVLLLTTFFNRTRLGLGFRAVATAPGPSRIVGIRVERMHVIGWGLAASVGAVAGVSLTNLSVYVDPQMMTTILVYSLAAVTIGGFDSVTGAVVGGLIVGIVQSLISGLIPNFSGDAGILVALVVIAAVLLASPQGLFGREQVARA
jgi:branched-chain amino acid transport system permease protein